MSILYTVYNVEIIFQKYVMGDCQSKNRISDVSEPTIEPGQTTNKNPIKEPTNELIKEPVKEPVKDAVKKKLKYRQMNRPKRLIRNQSINQ